MAQDFIFRIPTKVIFGQGQITEVGFETRELKAKRILIVTDSELIKTDLVERVKSQLKAFSLVEVFSDVMPDSSLESVEKGRDAASKAGADLLIAVGGGSAIDTAKGINIVLSGGGSLKDYEGCQTLSQPLKPLIAIPTTAGTGSEVTSQVVIKDRAEGRKLVFNEAAVAPTVAILDPEMTETLPPILTASTGMDALSHAIESLHSVGSEPITDALAFQAIRLIFENLPKATFNGKNLKARGKMQIAACLAGMAFSNALVGLVHAMAHPLGGRYGVAHGIANAILLPHVMEFNLDECWYKYVSVAEAMRLHTRGLAENVAKRAIKGISLLARECQLPQRLREVGVPKKGLRILAEDALTDGSIVNNRKEASFEDIQKIYQKAW